MDNLFIKLLRNVTLEKAWSGSGWAGEFETIGETVN